ncbi:MAG: helix-turn-helix domain-containing protein [Lachnospiraceae bacterium]|nr:helix-turn-helix domain-containing protein [Lachnospiraceae bacterium]
MKRKKSYRFIYFISFIIMLIIPMVTMIFNFWKADSIVRSQTLNLASKSMEQYSEMFDMTFKEMSDTCLSIFGSEALREYHKYAVVNSDNKYIQSYKINDMLRQLDLEKYYDVFVYFPTDDKIISANKSTLNSKYYYNVYYGQKKGDYYQEFLEVMNCNARQPEIYALNSNGPLPYLCVAMNTKDTLKVNYTICVVLDPTYVEEICQSADGVNEASSFFVLNEEKELLLASNERMSYQDIILSLSLEELANNKWHKGEDYMLGIIEADSGMKNFYAYGISQDYFWDVLTELRMACLGGIILCAMVSLMIAYGNTVRMYKPINNLLNKLTGTKKADYDKRRWNEFDFLEHSFNESSTKIKNSQRAYVELYMLKLLDGKPHTLEGVQEFVKNMPFVSKKFLICIIKVDYVQDSVNDQCSVIVRNVFEELAASHGKGYLVAYSQNEYVLWLNITGEMSEFIKDLQYGQRFLDQHFHIFMTFGISDVHEEAQNIPRCLREAQEAIRYQYLFGQGETIIFSQIAERETVGGLEETSNIFTALMEFITNNEGIGVAQFIEDFFQSHHINEDASIDRITLFTSEVLEVLRCIISKYDYLEGKYSEVLKELADMPSLMSFRTCMSRLLQSIQEEVPDENEELVLRTKQYIDDNYWDCGLSVAMLGDQMGVYSKKLSRVFKEKYQISIQDYLTNVRIDQAKKFLSEKEMSIQEIAEATGFLRSQVFIKKFKEQEGITPGNYKKIKTKCPN